MPQLELRPHPARRLNKITGKLEPLIKDLQSIWLDGKLIGYCGAVPNRPITLLRYYEDSERDVVLEFVAKQGLNPSRVCCPPKQEEPPPQPSSIWTPDSESEPDPE